ncbi:MAG: hypothetical protein EP338_08985 [Bacteroidetes bacterium]|nr:MAG: hypothetical protein EP338_08985 [Bacteroidota bacterium]
MKRNRIKNNDRMTAQPLAVFMAFLMFFESTFALYSSNGVKIERLIDTRNIRVWPLDSESNDEAPSIKPPALKKVRMMPNGPDQPEVQSFTPIEASDMVDPFTGDFSYNIPLLDVDGYPINLSYKAGVSSDQEASWVGLGWNLNPGVVNRAMRGIPDEFNGKDIVTKKFNLKDNWTVGGTFGYSSEDTEIFGFEIPNNDNEAFTWQGKLGVKYNNYTGFGADVSIVPSFKTGDGVKTKTFALGISGSSSDGATLSPSFSYANENSKPDGPSSIQIGSALNSRHGVREVNFQRTKTTKFVRKGTEGKKDRTTSVGMDAGSRFNLGMSTYTPSISMPMNTFGLTFSFKTGIDLFGVDPALSISGYYSKQSLREKVKELPAYGYQYLELGQDEKEVMLDFNRENDGVFTKKTPALPIPSLTYDLFNISGQGVSGSYRMQRKDIGYVFDAKEKTNSVNGSAGFELGSGGTAKAGADISVTYSQANSGAWRTLNQAAKNLGFQSNQIYFREANEMALAPDIEHLNRLGGTKAVRFNNNTMLSLQNVLEYNDNTELPTIKDYKREQVEKQNQVVYALTRDEVDRGLGLEDYTNLYAPPSGNDIGHHIAQITTLDTEGKRYVYGIAAYNVMQRQVSFAVNNVPANADNLVSYTTKENSENNESGRDGYFNSVTTGAYPHSHLLTAVLGPDYIDSDEEKGPSIGDKGYYVKFSYLKVANSYGWRNPIEEGKAFFEEGLNRDSEDNKGNYTYGEKELWYLNQIETKNYVAVFLATGRNDSESLMEDGAPDPSNSGMVRLNRIVLYARKDFEDLNFLAEPIKTVHFEYYDSGDIGELCKAFPLGGNGSGKLTLKRVYFTYKNSRKGEHTPYEFEYYTQDINSGAEAVYSTVNTDRWGSYTSGTGYPNLKVSDFPYCGMDEQRRNNDAAVWNLKQITLPSKGKIKIYYEADDYGYVQHKPAQNMFRILGVDGISGTQTSGDALISDVDLGLANPAIYCELHPDVQDPAEAHKYYQGLDKVYFRVKMKFGSGYDYVPGYAEIDFSSAPSIVNVGTQKMLKLQLKGVRLNDNFGTDVNPLAQASIQFSRLYLSQFIPPMDTEELDEGATMADLGRSLLAAFTSMGELVTGPNVAIYKDPGKFARELRLGESFVRLVNPAKKKIGGGHRVSRIEVLDAWNELTGNDQATYGQTYEYTLEDGSSSGVASYEPQLGGDENAWKTPVDNIQKNFLAPDIRNYQEEPFGESYFPSPSVGYSKVTVRDILPTNVTRHGTGKVVHEFYTAKDFPTIVSRTDPQIRRVKLPVFAYFFSLSIDEMSASQGFSIENNDMHGKPRAQLVYQQDLEEPISKVEYFYQSKAIVLDGIPANQLVNDVTVIEPNGKKKQGTIGINYDAVADFRKFANNTLSGTISGNLNFTAPVIVVPSILGSGSYERTAFRSATFTKSIERFGIMSNTVATDLGSEVETNNLAYDSETGAVLLTQTTTNFNDKIYNFTYPAHWYYDGMGQAYKNVNKSFQDTYTLGGNLNVINYEFTAGKTDQLTSNDGFVEGDEVRVISAKEGVLDCWVLEATPNYIYLVSKLGQELIAKDVSEIKIIRSGRRNLQSTPIGSVTLKSNPLNGISANVFANVLDASAVEFKDKWRADCDCNGEDNSQETSNPYVLGTKGNWRPSTNYTHLTNRTQTFERGNSNIRVDGVYKSFNPFYRYYAGKWNIDKYNWTFVSSVVDFNQNGLPLETVDALNRYGATRYGYNNTLQTAVAVNTRYRELGFNSFEDDTYSDCKDEFPINAGDKISTEDAHTGRSSMLLNAGESVEVILEPVDVCDPPACAITLTQNATSGVVSVSEAVEPYQFDYQIISGQPSLSLLNDGAELGISGSNYVIRVTVTDANQCKKTVEFKK